MKPLKPPTCITDELFAELVEDDENIVVLVVFFVFFFIFYCAVAT